MPRACTICTHEKRYEIEELLATRQGTYRGISRTYGLSEDAVSRHVASGHVSELIKLAADAERAARADTLLDRIEALQSRTLAILDEAEEAGDLRTALAAIAQSRGNLELIGEVTKELNRSPTFNLTLNPEYLELRSAILVALEPHPEAAESVSRAMLEIENGHR